jgi:hypothetical protein
VKQLRFSYFRCIFLNSFFSTALSLHRTKLSKEPTLISTSQPFEKMSEESIQSPIEEVVEEEDPEEVEERLRAAEMEATRLVEEAAAAREAERKARKRQTIGMLEAASDDPFFSSLIQEEDDITDDIEDRAKNGGRIFEQQLISPSTAALALPSNNCLIFSSCYS